MFAFLLVLWLTVDSVELMKPNLHENFTETEIIKRIVSPGQQVKLTCMKKGINTTNDVVWFFKNCDDKCNVKEDGRKICGSVNQFSCSVKLILETPQTGIYKCYKTEKKVGYVVSASLVIAYQLISNDKNLQPDFIEPPNDAESFVGSSVLFQCRVKSSLPVHVNWYKRVNKSPGAIQYENKFYQMLNITDTTRTKDISLSRLKMKKLAKSDEGIYACGAINEAGIRYREAKLEIEDQPAKPFENANELEGYWKLALCASAIVFIVFAVKSVVCVRLMKTQPVVQERKPRRMRPVPEFDPNETSDYEHVINL